MQWWLYYPAVLDLADLHFTDVEQTTIATSLTAYRAGDLLQALAAYPAGRQPESDEDRLYLAALLLGVVQVEKASALLDTAVKQPALATALRTMIAAVNLRKLELTANPSRASEWLARSYYEQAHFDLAAALVFIDQNANSDIFLAVRNHISVWVVQPSTHSLMSCRHLERIMQQALVLNIITLFVTALRKWLELAS